ncbi:MAG: hypothetical protein MJ087_06275 [Lachnospiraceae bacterium]|nr:hypothetical protein [Lachnospiraceae bacterium]
MNFLDKLEQKFGRFAIRNLALYLCFCYVAGAVIDLVAPGLYDGYLAMNPYMILHGQVWRIFTFLLAPLVNMRSVIGIIFIFFVISLYYNICLTLQKIWGDFRFNMYMLTGMVGTILSSFILYFVTGSPYITMDSYYIQLALFLAFASLFPNQELLLYGILPIKMKWLAYIDVAFLAVNFVTAGNHIFGWCVRVSIIVAILNFLIYFFAGRSGRKYRPSEINRKRKFKKRVQPPKSGARHRCAVCNRTELDDPTLEFRYCSKCEGNYEYCQDHLFTHTHVK